MTMTHTERKEQFIKSLAMFLAQNQGAKSILLQMERERSPADPRPRLAVEWAELLAISPLTAYSTVEEATKALKEFLG